VSGALTATITDPAAVVSGDPGRDAGVTAGRELRQFARAVLDPKEAPLRIVRANLERALGGPGLGDAAAVVAFFDAINRIADATGVELEAMLSQHADLLLGDLDLSGMRGPDSNCD